MDPGEPGLPPVHQDLALEGPGSLKPRDPVWEHSVLVFNLCVCV